MINPQLVIQTENLGKSFGEVTALQGLNLQVPVHSITGFLGPNGAGKSTTIRLLLGLMAPTAGSGQIFGLDIQRHSAEIRRRVGYLAQSPRFYPEMSAREILEFSARFFYSGPRDAINDRVEEMLALVGLSEKADRPVKGFSGGERQRLGIAQAQVNAPDLLILDEPAAALDPMGRLDVLNIMEKLREKTTIFYSTHILDDVQRVSDRVVILNQGEMIAQGLIEDLLSAGREVIYHITLEGQTAAVKAKLDGMPWIAGIMEKKNNGLTQWQVSVSDPDLAKREMLPLLVGFAECTVIHYGRKERELEEVFMQVVSGDNHEG